MDWSRIISPAYWITFAVTFLAVAQWESVRPERKWIVPAGRRWTRHAMLLVLTSAIRLLLFRLSPMGVAALAANRGWGLFHAPFFGQGLGSVVAIVLTVLLLDISKYTSHRLMHSFGWLWRLHRVHHSDPDFDLSTGLRFHPLEAMLVAGFDLLVIWLAAPPLAGVVVSTVIACFVNFAQHANATLPESWERTLGPLLVTARIHRIHHSTGYSDQNSNFGELVPWWDKLFGTYHPSAEAGPSFEVGLPGYQTARSVEFGEMLLQPLHPPREPEMKTAGAASSGDSGR
jgi:sterol desaturase/sphingolipid hydroxylase (fatty acid hydroxylase superfamily)